jgi:hypothetical protein
MRPQLPENRHISLLKITFPDNGLILANWSKIQPLSIQGDGINSSDHILCHSPFLEATNAMTYGLCLPQKQCIQASKDIEKFPPYTSHGVGCWCLQQYYVDNLSPEPPLSGQSNISPKHTKESRKHKANPRNQASKFRIIVDKSRS